MKHRFLIITPVINPNYLLADTIKSIITQIGIGDKFSITYVIADAGSVNDEEQNFISNMLSEIGTVDYVDLIHVKYKDKSMYDGIVNALSTINDKRFTIFAYINSGDYYSPYAFNAVVDEMNGNNSSWVCGCVGSYNSKGMLYKLIEPVAYPVSLIKSGFFGRYLPYIQQESNFIRYELVRDLDLTKLASLKYAGDFFIWKSLADRGFKPSILPVWLAGFREHEGQLSSVYSKEYKSEFNSLCDNVKPLAVVKAVFVFAFYVIHPRLRSSKFTLWMRKWR